MRIIYNPFLGVFFDFHQIIGLIILMNLGYLYFFKLK